jgi:hypothetical protein
MEQFLSQWGAAGQKAVLRGAMVSVFSSERRKVGGDADGVWLMGRLEPDGVRARGIANKTIEALEEIGVMEVSWAHLVQEAPIRKG